MLLLSALTEPKADLRDLAGTIPGFDFSPVFRSGHFEWVAPTVGENHPTTIGRKDLNVGGFILPFVELDTGMTTRLETRLSKQ